MIQRNTKAENGPDHISTETTIRTSTSRVSRPSCSNPAYSACLSSATDSSSDPRQASERDRRVLQLCHHSVPRARATWHAGVKQRSAYILVPRLSFTSIPDRVVQGATGGLSAQIEEQQLSCESGGEGQGVLQWETLRRRRTRRAGVPCFARGCWWERSELGQTVLRGPRRPSGVSLSP